MREFEVDFGQLCITVDFEQLCIAVRHGGELL